MEGRERAKKEVEGLISKGTEKACSVRQQDESISALPNRILSLCKVLNWV